MGVYPALWMIPVVKSSFTVGMLCKLRQKEEMFQLFIGKMCVSSWDTEIRVMYICVRHINIAFVPTILLDVGIWNCSDVVLWLSYIFHLVKTGQLYIQRPNTTNDSQSRGTPRNCKTFVSQWCQYKYKISWKLDGTGNCSSRVRQ